MSYIGFCINLFTNIMVCRAYKPNPVTILYNVKQVAFSFVDLGVRFLQVRGLSLPFFNLSLFPY